MIKRRFFITLVGLSATCLILYPNLVEQKSQAQVSGTDDESPLMKLQNVPFGTKTGEEELQALLQFSEPTQSPNIRKVVIPIPTNNSGESLPEDALKKLPGVIAWAEFSRIVERESYPPAKPQNQEKFQENGKKGRLSSGGILHLRVDSKKTPVTATISISGYDIPGYEKVRTIEFVLPQTAGS